MWKSILFLICFSQSAIGWEISKLTTPEIRIPHSAYSDDDSLYFVTFITSEYQASINRYSYIDGIFYSAYIEGVTSPSFIVPINQKVCKKCRKCDAKLFAVGVGHDVLKVKWNGKSTKAKVVGTIFSVENNIPSSRYDVATTDSHGRLYTGTLSETLCNSTATRSFYRYTRTAGADRLFGGLKSTTGIAFNDEIGKMYHFDSCQLYLTEYDYDPETGDICNGRVIFEYTLNGIPHGINLPFGMVLDTKGMIYISVYTGAVWKIDPWTSSVIEVIKLPVPGAFGLAFGGHNRDKLYVITSSSIVDAFSLGVVGEIAQGSSIFEITGLDSEGMPTTRMDVKKENCNTCGSGH